MANGDENAGEGEVFGSAVACGALEAYAGHAGFIAQHFVEFMVELECDIACGHFLHQMVDHDFFSFEGIAPVHQGHMAGDIGEIERFFHRRIAAADDGHFLIFIKETITCCAAGHAFAHERFF